MQGFIPAAARTGEIDKVKREDLRPRDRNTLLQPLLQLARELLALCLQRRLAWRRLVWIA